ncbi:CBS domain-containing protein [Legionella oakridgensis]|uniref:CBS domain protein n=2 Tax=Legionella oakridgensis TaxID=29423 RepID=A0A0W0WY12_9GAMM|nr:CBS domain-containing protein [Legionella oakridgensis]AHE67014.1 putative signal-transduction protein containing cAMP-binding and CBS domains [Legionella oakridgensis ATCC 33761 = DSM 21215]ETO93303.1 putative signal-transduction protein [Legionella oakridgensis RV-2-2007]KTD37168.1 CBS domain protein [Legionella oakridgensis]STY20113.1 CBS domain protein [Legionella longbeachae]
MKVGEFCNREVIVIYSDESVMTAAKLMRKHHVGNVILVEKHDDFRKPIGIITDRDLVIEVMVPKISPEDLVVRDLITGPLLTIGEEDSLYDALDLMRIKGIRRLPVIGKQGELVGIITIDDITDLLTEMLGRVAGVVEQQRHIETLSRS